MANFPVFTPDPRWFPMPTLQQGSPFGGVLGDAIAKRLHAAEAQSEEAKAKYADKNELQKLLYNEMVNKYYPQDITSQIGLRNSQSEHAHSQAGLTDRQSSKLSYELSHPELFYGGDDVRTIAGLDILRKKGLLPQDNRNPNVNNQPDNNSPTNQAQPSTSYPQNNFRQNIQDSLPNQQQEPNARPFNTGNSVADSVLNRKYASPAYQQKMASGFNWVHLPVETKNQLIAQGAGMGIDPLRMMDYVNKGMGLQDIAKAEGLDPANLPPPIYPPTAATKTRTQQVQQVGAELDYLSSATTPLISQYANTFAGISPDRIGDMLSNDPEAQKRFGRYMGALSVQTGIANGRVLLEGGKPGVEVMRMVKDSALKGIDQVVKPLKNTKMAYEEAQRTIDELLQRGAKIRTTTGMNPFSEIGKSHGKESSREESNKSEKNNPRYAKTLEELNQGYQAEETKKEGNVTYARIGDNWYPKK